MTERDGLSRRDFIARTFSGLAALSLTGVTAAPSFEAGAVTPQSGATRTVVNRVLGRTGIRLPVVNMGVMNADLPALVRRSFELGARYFDTAAYYQRGRNEEMVGQVLKELKARDQAMIGTKVYIPESERGMPSAQARDFFLRTVEGSLRRLQTDYIDVLYTHVVQSLDYLNHPGIQEAMQQLKDRKLVRFVGFSTHANMAQCLEEAARTGFYDVVLTAFNYSQFDDQALLAALRKAAAKGIGLIAMKTQCQQPWYLEGYPPELKERVGKFYEGRIMHTALLKWVLGHEFITCAVPGYTNFQQMEEDLSVLSDLSLTPAERRFLEDRHVKLALGSVCRQCARCVPTCPRAVDIPVLVRTHMYAACYPNFHLARDARREIAAGRGLDACASCPACQARCARGVQVARRIEELKSFYL